MQKKPFFSQTCPSCQTTLFSSQTPLFSPYTSLKQTSFLPKRALLPKAMMCGFVTFTVTSMMPFHHVCSHHENPQHRNCSCRSTAYHDKTTHDLNTYKSHSWQDQHFLAHLIGALLFKRQRLINTTWLYCLCGMLDCGMLFHNNVLVQSCSHVLLQVTRTLPDSNILSWIKASCMSAPKTAHFLTDRWYNCAARKVGRRIVEKKILIRLGQKHMTIWAHTISWHLHVSR